MLGLHWAYCTLSEKISFRFSLNHCFWYILRVAMATNVNVFFITLEPKIPVYGILDHIYVITVRLLCYGIFAKRVFEEACNLAWWIHSRSKYNCDYCAKTYSWKASLNNHDVSVHKGNITVVTALRYFHRRLVWISMMYNLFTKKLQLWLLR